MITQHTDGDTDHYDILMDVDGGMFDFQLSVWPRRDQAVFSVFPVPGNMDPIDGVTMAQDRVIEVKMPLSAVGGHAVRTLLVQTAGQGGVGDKVENVQATLADEFEPELAMQPGDGGQGEEGVSLSLEYDPEAVQAVIAAHHGQDLTSGSWLRLGGPPGGLGYDVRMRPDNPDVMFVTDAFAGVHKSIDGGQSWTPSNNGIDGRTGPSNDAIPVFCLTIDPNDYDIVWVGLQGQRGIFRSEDGGKNWERRDRGIVENSGLTVRGIAVEPGNSDVVYAAGEVSSFQWAGRNMPGVGFDRTKGVIYKSTDAGISWKAVWRGDNLARYVLIDPTNVNTLYASTGIFDREAANSDPSTRSPGGVGVIKSVDGGKTWRQINNGIENLYIGSLAMHPENPQILLAAADNVSYRAGGGVYLTKNGGESWEKELYGQGGFMSVEFNALNPDVWYATGGVIPFYITFDAGQTWQSYTSSGQGFWKPAGYRVSLPIDMQADPRDPLRLFVNNYGGGNYLTEDGGQTWRSASTGYTGAEIWAVAAHPDNPAIVYANGRSGPFVSTDGGLRWQGVNPEVGIGIQDGPQIAASPGDPRIVIASEAQFGWTYQSLDGGATWKRVIDFHDRLQGIPTHNQSGMTALAFAPSDPSRVYGGFGTWNCVSARSGGDCRGQPLVSVLTSVDSGGTWQEHSDQPLDGLSVTAIVVHPEDALTAWAATGGGGIYRTSDGGESWVSLSRDLAGLPIMAMALDPHAPETLYAGLATRGIYRSEDGGISWRSSSSGMDPNESISSVVVDPADTAIVYAGSTRSGVFVSLDNGRTWRPLNQGLRTRAILTLQITHDGTTLYAGTQGEGVFRLSTIGQEELEAMVP